MKVVWMMIVIAIVLGMASPLVAQGPYEWNLAFRGNENAFQGGFFWSPSGTERVQVGPEFSYWNKLKLPDGTERNGESLEVVARYFGLKDVPLQLWKFEVNTNWYLGLGLGPKWMKDEKVTNVADFRTGFLFGEGPIWFGVGYQGVVSDLLWEGIQGDNMDHRVFGEILIGIGRKKASAMDLP